MDCKQLVELVTDYLEGRMPDSDRARFDSHLAQCEGCTTYVEQIRATVVVAGTLREDDLPAGRGRRAAGGFPRLEALARLSARYSCARCSAIALRPSSGSTPNSSA